MKKNLIIIGSNGDLGTGIKKVLLKKNYDTVYLIDRKADANNNSSNVKSINVDDLSNEKNVEDLFGKINFNNDELYFMYSTVGGFAGGSSVEETEISTFDKMINMNLKTSFLLAQNFIKKVKKTKGGSICFTSAVTSLNAEEGKAAYGLAKAALNYLIEVLSEENKENRISINGVAPFALDTEANREWIEKNSDLVSPENIGIFVYSLFENFKIVSGNIIKLPRTLE